MHCFNCRTLKFSGVTFDNPFPDGISSSNLVEYEGPGGFTLHGRFLLDLTPAGADEDASG